MQRVINGIRGADGLRVEVCKVETANGVELTPLLELETSKRHSPTGFECGYGGSGPAELAFVLARWCLEDRGAKRRDAERIADPIHQLLKHLLVGALPREKSWHFKVEPLFDLVDALIGEDDAKAAECAHGILAEAGAFA